MKICFVGPANSAHIIKWCTWFSKRGHDIHVISFTSGKISDVTVHEIDLGVNTEGSDLQKLKYIFSGKKIKKIIDEIKPDIINVHYATSYGIAVALSGLKDYYLSVWGSDIYEFPNKSPLHKQMLKYSLRKAGHLFSTSQVMADEAGKYTDRKFEITPFGVDTELFNPDKRTRDEASEERSFIIGTVKGLSDTYGIADIIKAAYIFHRNNPEVDIELRLAGKGPQEAEYRELAKTLEIDHITTWLGFISQEDAAREWANMDVAVIPSKQESFGVAALEAQACEVPVIISDIPGLTETTVPGSSSVVVPVNDPQAITSELEILYKNPELRKRMGAAGRKNVLTYFEMDSCFERIEHYYE